MNLARSAVCIALFVLMSASQVIAESAGTDLPDLRGIGGLNFEFDETSFVEFGPSLAESGVGASAKIDASGAVSACEVIGGESGERSLAGQRVCAALRKGYFRTPTWYQPYMRGGHFDITLSAAKAVVPVSPIKLVDVEKGLPTSIMVFSGRCMVGKPSMAQADNRAVCSAYDALNRPNLTGAPPFQSAMIGLVVEPNAHPFLPYVYPLIGDRGQTVQFAPRSDNEPGFASGDGRLSVAITAEDYPPLAIRERIEGRVRVLIGFDRSGVARTCRPVSSDNSTILANMTCAIFVNKAHYEFSPNAPSFDGLHYFMAPISWVIPRG